MFCSGKERQNLREQHIFGNVNKQHNGLLSLFRYTFPAMLKFCSIETAFRKRQISSFVLICGFIVNEVDRAIYKYAFLLNKRQDFRITPYFIMHTVLC